MTNLGIPHPWTASLLGDHWWLVTDKRRFITNRPHHWPVVPYGRRRSLMTRHHWPANVTVDSYNFKNFPSQPHHVRRANLPVTNLLSQHPYHNASLSLPLPAEAVAAPPSPSSHTITCFLRGRTAPFPAPSCPLPREHRGSVQEMVRTRIMAGWWCKVEIRLEECTGQSTTVHSIRYCSSLPPSTSNNNPLICSSCFGQVRAFFSSWSL